MTATEPSSIAVKKLAADDRRDCVIKLRPSAHPHPTIPSDFLMQPIDTASSLFSVVGEKAQTIQ
jgi:hypothetical protein